MQIKGFSTLPAFSLVLAMLIGCDDGTSLQPLDPDAQTDAAPADTEVVDAMPPPPDLGTPCTVIKHAYAPLDATELTQFPDDIMTRSDEMSPTGLRVDPDPDIFPWLNVLPALVTATIPDLAHLSGFSRVGRIFVSFDSPVLADRDDPRVPDHAEIVLLDMTVEPPASRAFMAQWGPEKTGLFVQPLEPLLPGHRHALVVGREVLGGTDTCLEPSDTLRDLVAGVDMPPRLEDLSSRYQEAVNASGFDAEEVVAATVFTTHRDLDVLFRVASQIKDRQFSWGSSADCRTTRRIRTCQITFTARDYRDERAIVTERPANSWEIPVTIHTPVNQEGPLPVIFYGHGLNSSRSESQFIADALEDARFVVVAADAMFHGNHPTRTDPDNVAALDFLGLYIAELRLDGFQMRGNFNQTILDRLQLVQLIRQQPDFDGDGVDDLDGDTIVYFGASLGGMLGSALLAMEPAIKAGVFAVAGGGLMGFVTGTETISMFRPALINLFGTEGNFERMLTVAQSLVDAADPSTHAPQVLRRRRTGDDGFMPHILLPVSRVDDTVPPPTGEALARALGLPHIEPVSTPVLGLDTQMADVSGNAPNGEATIGYFQFDQVTLGERTVQGSHSDTPRSREAIYQLRRFLEPVMEGEPAVIVDPYDALGTP